jgi:hypothetical protein
LLALTLLPAHSFCLQIVGNPPEPESGSKHMFGIIPNYRTSPTLAQYKPLTVKEKFDLSRREAFDLGAVALSGLFAGKAMLSKREPSFGQEANGYARYWSATYADFVINDFMSGAVYPALLHQDPRYFRRGTGSALSRVTYAVSQVFWTHNDSGDGQFNFSRVLGASTAVAISNAYYPDQRTAGDTASRLGIRFGIDMGSAVLMEFWPDLRRKFFQKHQANSSPPSATW